MQDFETTSDSEIKTAFRPRAWWLRYVRRYKFLNRKRVPHQNTFGELYYKTYWTFSKDRK